MSIVRRAAHAASLVLFVSGPLAAPLAAQEPAPGEPVEASAPRAEEPEAYARIERAETVLRCFPTAYSPLYDEQLGEGDVVVPTGDERNGFRAVRLPLGVPGYVHGRFAEVGADGIVRSQGSRVAFRYRPSSAEAPLQLVEDGTEFLLVAVEGDWLRVRLAGHPAWIAADAAVVFPAAEAGETIVAAWRSHGERQRQQIADAAAKVEAERAAAARLTELRTELDALVAQFRSEVAKPDVEQDVAALRDAAAAVVEQAPADTELRADAERLLAEVERQARAIAMLRIVSEEEPTPDPEAVVPTAATDPFGDYATGWLRVSGGLFTERRYSLEKGGQVIFELECRTGRYSLDVFENMEVAVRGPAERPDPERMRRLDVQRIEVLALPRR